MALPFANDGSFLEQFQAAQQQQQQGQAPQQQLELQQPPAADHRGQGLAGRSAPAHAEQHAQGAPQWQGGAYGEGSKTQDWQQHSHEQFSGAESGPWGQPDWKPPASAQNSAGSCHTAHQQQHTQQQLEPGEYRPEAGEAYQHQQQQQLWQQEQQFYAEAAQPSSDRYGSEPGTSSQAWDEQVAQETYDPAAGLTVHEQQQQEYEAGAAAAQQYYEQQQWQQASHAEPPQINDFNECPTFNGPFPGFVFKLGGQGLGYYRDTPPIVAASDAKDTVPKPAAKPKAISINNSIVKGLALRPGIVKKKKKPDEDAGDKPRYLREMEAWQKQACSGERGAGSLVK